MSCSLVMVAASGSCLHEQPEEEQGVDLTAAAPWRPGRGEGGCRGGWKEKEEKAEEEGEKVRNGKEEEDMENNTSSY